MRIFGKYLWVLALVLSFGCKEQFAPQLKETNGKLLVVEGMINVGGERTHIRLSRTVPVAQKGNRTPEVGAQVSIESNANQSYALTDKGLGEYESGLLNLDPNKKYRLKIVSKGVEYITDYLDAKISPPIDELNWEVKQNGVQISVNTHDDTNSSKYYRWDFDDTYIFYAKYMSALVWEGSSMRRRDLDAENIYKCWGEGISTSIVVGSTVKLTEDIVHKQPIVLIPSVSEKLSERYSILVRQYALTKEAFEFWENLRKNTENLRSIFDAQPSQLTGNIYNVKNPSEPVLGFISVGSVTSKRIFISKTELPDWKFSYPFDCGLPDTLKLSQTYLFSDPKYIPLEEVYNDAGILTGYTSTTKTCGDCTFRGTTRRPAFWQ